MDKKARRVFVSGSNRGIGKSIALELAQEGFSVVLHCRTHLEEAESTAKEISKFSDTPTILQFDVSDRSASSRALESDISSKGCYYGVVLNAGTSSDAPFPGMSGEQWDAVIRTNLDGFYNVLHPVMMPMISSHQGGRIVAMSSLAGIAGNRGQTNYSASKAGLIGAVKALSQEVAKRNITVNCIAPGLIETDMLRNLPKEELLKRIPMRRFGTPEEVAAVVSFLFSAQASYITAQVISVNGGML